MDRKTWTIEDAIKGDSIVDVNRLHSEYEITIGELPPVKIRIWMKLKGNKGFYFTQSHFIQTPLQGGAYQTNSSYDESDVAYLLHLAINTIRSHYDEAVNANKQPDASWLVVNDNF